MKCTYNIIIFDTSNVVVPHGLNISGHLIKIFDIQPRMLPLIRKPDREGPFPTEENTTICNDVTP